MLRAKLASLINNSRQLARSSWKLSIRLSSSKVEVHTNNDTSEYRYTLDSFSSKLSKEQRDYYETNGYLVVTGLLASKQIDKYGQRFNDIATGRVEPEPGLILMRELAAAKKAELSEKTLYKIQELYADHVLFGYCRHRDVLDYVQCFTGPNIVVITAMFINKPTDERASGARLSRMGGRCEQVLAWHQACAQHAGDCVFFHPLLIHGSGMNRTNGLRRVISCHYAAAECNYIDVKETIEERQAEEIINTYLNKLNMPEAYIDYWMSFVVLVVDDVSWCCVTLATVQTTITFGSGT